jgi:hypothetical protein
MSNKLDSDTAKHCAAQLVGALEAICSRHGWSPGDMVAVSSVAFTEIVARRLGRVRTIEFFRDHSDHLETEVLP